MNDQMPHVPLEETLDATLGVVIGDVEIGRVTATMPVHNGIKQPFGIVHGGALASLAESLASIGTYRGVYEEGKIAMGMSNQTQFLRSITEGTIHGEAIAIHKGSTTWVWDVTLSDDSGRVCAVTRMTIAVRDRRA